MVGKQIIAAVTVALSGLVSADGAKPFKFEVTSGGKTYYLTTSGASVASAAQAVSCTIDAGYLNCGGKGGPTFRGDMVKMNLVSGKGSSGWSLSGDKIKWNNKAFSLYRGTTDIWAESCPHGHFPVHGTAKAVFA